MNPSLIVLILLGGFLLWFLLSFTFRDVGWFVSEFFTSPKKMIDEEKEEYEEE